MLGVGRNNIGSEDDEYSWEFTFTPRYYFLDTPKHQMFVSGKIGWQTELTNSNTTTEQRQTLFEDLEVGTGYSYTAYTSADEETKISPGISAGLVFPTSKASSEGGKYLVTKLSAGPRGVFKLLGEKAKGLNNVIVYGSATWSHLFARSYDATNETLQTNNYIQSSSGSALIQSDQMNLKSFDMDRLKFTFGYFLPLYGDLYFANSWAITERYKHGFGSSASDCIRITTGGCAQPSDSAQPPSTRSVDTTFDISLSYDFFDSSLRWDVGYQNDTAQLGEDGTRRNVFYSPSAAFYMDVIVLFDGVYKQVDKRVNKKAMASMSKRFGLPF